MLQGVELAIEDVNRAGGPGGHALETLVLDSGGPGAEGLTRPRAVASYRQFVEDPAVVAVVGPQTSSEGRAVAALLSRAGMATITPSSTTYDITDPALRERFRPGGQAVYFRTVGTDLVQAEAMARFAHDRLGARRVVAIHDGTAFGTRMVVTFARQAQALGMTLLAQQPLRWTSPDHSRELRAARALDPDAVYFAGGYLVGLRVAKQVADILPTVHRLGAENLYNGAFPRQAGRESAQGWYVSNVAPDPAAGLAAAAWAERFRRRFDAAPTGDALAAYTAVTVISDAVERAARGGRPVTRARLRDAIQATRLPVTAQGRVSFDDNGDLEHPLVSIYQVRDGAFRFVEAIAGDGAARPPTSAGRP
jgi:branched-chain amino acid transport system substrate-binding protein